MGAAMTAPAQPSLPFIPATAPVATAAPAAAAAAPAASRMELLVDLMGGFDSGRCTGSERYACYGCGQWWWCADRLVVDGHTALLPSGGSARRLPQRLVALAYVALHVCHTLSFSLLMSVSYLCMCAA